MAEVLAIAAGIAGLIGLTGQCLTNAHKLQDLYGNTKKATQTVQKFLKELNSLIRTLTAIQSLLERFQSCGISGLGVHACDIVSLPLQDCHNDIRSWLAAAERLLPALNGSKGTGLKYRLRKISIAANKDELVSVREDMLVRRTELSVALSTLGRELDVHLARAAKSMEAGVQETHAQTLLSHAALERIEAASVALSDEVNSIKSMISAGRSTSGDLPPRELQRKMHETSQRISVWRCDGWHTLSQLCISAESTTCALCGFAISEDEHQLSGLRIHLEDKHDLTACAHDATPFIDVHDFHDHLVDVHHAEIGPWTPTIDEACIVADNAAAKRGEKYVQLVVRPSGQEHLSIALHDDLQSDLADGRNVSLQEADAMQAKEAPESDLHALLMASWQSTLLRDWTSASDRINKWMLHMLGEEPEHLNLHRQIFVSNHGQPSIEGRDWARMVMTYWSLDAAAAGNVIPESGAENAKRGRVESSLYMSMHKTGQTRESLGSRIRGASIRSGRSVGSVKLHNVSSPTHWNNPHDFLAIPQPRSDSSGYSACSTGDTMGSIASRLAETFDDRWRERVDDNEAYRKGWKAPSWPVRPAVAMSSNESMAMSTHFAGWAYPTVPTKRGILSRIIVRNVKALVRRSTR